MSGVTIHPSSTWSTCPCRAARPGSFVLPFQQRSGSWCSPRRCSLSQPDAGNGSWDDANLRSFSGVVVATLRGEILDSKCFLGAMRPGEGKTHKECAALCIAGGISPMLITRDERGTATYYLLTNSSGGAMGPEVLPLVADPVEIRGEVEHVGGLLRLRVRGAITRL